MENSVLPSFNSEEVKSIAEEISNFRNEDIFKFNLESKTEVIAKVKNNIEVDVIRVVDKINNMRDDELIALKEELERMESVYIIGTKPGTRPSGSPNKMAPIIGTKPGTRPSGSPK